MKAQSKSAFFKPKYDLDKTKLQEFLLRFEDINMNVDSIHGQFKYMTQLVWNDWFSKKLPTENQKSWKFSWRTSRNTSMTTRNWSTTSSAILWHTREFLWRLLRKSSLQRSPRLRKMRPRTLRKSSTSRESWTSRTSTPTRTRSCPSNWSENSIFFLIQWCLYHQRPQHQTGIPIYPVPPLHPNRAVGNSQSHCGQSNRCTAPNHSGLLFLRYLRIRTLPNYFRKIVRSLGRLYVAKMSKQSN